MKEEINCYELDGVTIKNTMERPDVLDITIRNDVIQLVVKCLRASLRQPYAVNKDAGMQHSAKSWGTGRAMARVPRVAGSGTRRAGQGAFANFCRGGRMAHPTSVNRRWARKITLKNKMHGLAMGVAATAIPSLVESRGHNISQVKSLPLVVSDEINQIKTTKEAIKIIENFGLKNEIIRVKESKCIRAGKGKMRNRRYILKKGLLIIYKGNEKDMKALRNIAGVDLMSVEEMCLLKLCPGAQPGRLVLWTESAFKALKGIFGDLQGEGSNIKNYALMNKLVSTDDVEGLYYSEEVQALLNTPNLIKIPKLQKKDISKLNPYLHLFTPETV